jgi:hypothetical protein
MVFLALGFHISTENLFFLTSLFSQTFSFTFLKKLRSQERIKKMALPCPCCGYLTMEDDFPGTYDICPVCFWEDDNVQFDDPCYEGGANGVSLNQAKLNFKKFGAAKERLIEYVRRPLPDEIPPS